MKTIIKPYLHEAILQIYKKISPNHFPHGWDAAFDIQRVFKNHKVETIFDVGANIGQTALYYRKRFPDAKIYSFEPVKDTYFKLAKNLQSIPNTSCFQYALGAKVGQEQIVLHHNSERNNLLNLKTHNSSNSQIETIEIITVEQFCQQNRIDKIDILKMDTEGYELEVLKGTESLLEQSKIKFIFSEVSFIKATKVHTLFFNIYEQLYTKDFRFYGLYDSSYNYNRLDLGMIFCNALFVNEKAFKTS